MINLNDPKYAEKIKSVTEHYSAAYLLISFALDHLEQGNETLKTLGMFSNMYKMWLNGAMRNIDLFISDFNSMIKSKTDKSHFAEDYSNLSKSIDIVLGFDTNKIKYLKK